MTRYPNPLVAVSDLIAKAFAVLADRDNPGGRSAFVVMSPRSRSRHVPTPQAPGEKAPLSPHGVEDRARPVANMEGMRRRPHTDARSASQH